ncbi:hypothetical protein ACHAXR_002716 [Thalassiosira sp. AJA248-18]
MDGESPSWLEDGASSTPAAADPTPPYTAPAVDAAASPAFTIDEAAEKTARAPAATDNVAGSILASMNTKSNADTAPAATNDVDEADLPKIILVMRVLNMASAVLLITCSIIELTRLPHISVWVTSIYATCGGLLVCCLETQLKFVRTIIAMNFGFLFHSVYRFLFYCLMASVTWSYGGMLGYVTAILLGVVAVFNTYVLCRYPAYRKIRENVAAEEDKRIQAKINQQVRKQAVSQMGWGKN